MQAYRQLTNWKAGFCLFAGVLFARAVLGPWDWLAQYVDMSTENLTLLGIAAIIIAVAHFGAIICHELYEINDQLAGRSPELKEWLRQDSGGRQEPHI